jgi:hypothetical protein
MGGSAPCGQASLQARSEAPCVIMAVFDGLNKTVVLFLPGGVPRHSRF